MGIWVEGMGEVCLLWGGGGFLTLFMREQMSPWIPGKIFIISQRWWFTLFLSTSIKNSGKSGKKFFN
jgi:hypothetical protein